MVTKGSELALVARLEGSPLLIGREIPADLVIENHFVSRRHALISPGPDGYSISDQNSKNGTSVNDDSIGLTPVLLKNGDMIRIANGEVEMRFQVTSATATIKLSSREFPIGNDVSGLKVDLPSRTVTINGVNLDPPLVGRQYALLQLLYGSGGNACSWDEIQKAGWPDRDQGMVGRNEIIQAVHEIRKRLSTAGCTVEISSVRGFGYRLDR
ncbi:FHA domain-containing protein [Dehalococcoides mccartyi]|nr:FHA domain-containing protein [Dehalococcoides mccartyi]